MRALFRTVFLLLPVLLVGLLPASSPAQIGVSVSITTAPPMLPAYSQPPCPNEGYLWEPGYWAWGSDGYYWVPGVWVMPPQPGLFWTPGYWAFEDGNYMWNEGYWAPEVGFYGGVDYGFGYPGEGFYGGMWQGSVFRYNVTVWHVGHGFHDTYRAPVTWHAPYHSHASFNGQGGIPARPTPQEQRAMHAQHYQPTAQQVQHRDTASRNPQYQYKANHGKPQHAAMARVSGAPANNQQRPARNAQPNGHPANARPNAGNSHRSAAHTQRPAPPVRPAPSRPQARTQPRQQSRPAPQPHPQSRPQSRPAPRTESRPQSRPAAKPHAESRPAPHPESHPKAPEKPHSQA